MKTEINKSDSQIQKEVGRELAWDTRVSPTEIGVQVKDSVVTLTGVVDTWTKIGAAEDAARRVKGVLDVVTDLTVKLAGTSERTDAEIAAAVRRTLEWDVLVPDHQIRSTVTHGVVTLRGTVGYWSQRHDAERAIDRLTGVTRVVNRIDVRPEEEVNIDDARRAVAKALELHAQRDASHVELRSSDRVVHVAGFVHTLREKAAVIGAVRGTRGVREIDNHLHIEPRAGASRFYCGLGRLDRQAVLSGYAEHDDDAQDGGEETPH